MKITHEPGCPEQRIEHFVAMQPSGLGAAVSRCVDCGAQTVYCQPDMVLTPGTPAYATAWALQPSRIAAQLHPADYYDPEKNPLHPLAQSTAPGVPRPRIPQHRLQNWSHIA